MIKRTRDIIVVVADAIAIHFLPHLFVLYVFCMCYGRLEGVGWWRCCASSEHSQLTSKAYWPSVLCSQLARYGIESSFHSCCHLSRIHCCRGEKKIPSERCFETFSWDIRWFSMRCCCCFRRETNPFRTNNWNWHENCIYTLCVATRDGKQKIPFVRYVENEMQSKKIRKVIGCIAQVINKPTPFHSQSNPLRTHSHNISSTCQSIKITHAKKTNTYMLCIHDVLLWIVEICMYNSGRNSCVSSTWWNLRVCCCAAKMNWIFSLRSFAHWRWIAVNKSVLIFFSLFSRLANPLWSLGEKEKSIK